MTREEKIEKLKQLADEYDEFTVPDRWPFNDGWDGCLEEDGAYCYGNNHFEGEFYKYEEMDDALIDTILDRGDFDDE